VKANRINHASNNVRSVSFLGDTDPAIFRQDIDVSTVGLSNVAPISAIGSPFMLADIQDFHAMTHALHWYVAEGRFLNIVSTVSVISPTPAAPNESRFFRRFPHALLDGDVVFIGHLFRIRTDETNVITRPIVLLHEMP